MIHPQIFDLGTQGFKIPAPVAAFAAVGVVYFKAVLVIAVKHDKMSGDGKVARAHGTDNGAAAVKVVFHAAFV